MADMSAWLDRHGTELDRLLPPDGAPVNPRRTDPDELLKIIRAASISATNGTDVRRSERTLRWAVEDLDHLLINGGPLPTEWQR